MRPSVGQAKNVKKDLMEEAEEKELIRKITGRIVEVRSVVWRECWG